MTRRRRRQTVHHAAALSLRAAIVAAFVALPWVARAADATGGFAWTAPDGCPASSNVETRIRARVRGAWEWPVRRRVVPQGASVIGVLTTPCGQRALTAPTY